MDPFLGEIRTFGGNFAPIGWLPCDGRLLPISGNEALFTLLGTMYGGDGQTTFALPDLQGRAPVHRQQSGFPIGAKAGAETVALTSTQIPAHTHLIAATNAAGTTDKPTNALWAQPVPAGNPPPVTPKLYSASKDGTMSPQAVQSSGGNQPHDNMMPYLAVTFIIAVEGLFPSSS